MPPAAAENSPVPAARPAIGKRSGLTRFRAMMWGSLFLAAGLVDYVLGILLASVRHPLAAWLPAREISLFMIWYGGMPVMAGILLVAFEVVVLVPLKRRTTEVPFDAVRERRVTAVLTAFNDEKSIAAAVRDFSAHPLVRRVLVIDNNSHDATACRAREAGATVIVHREPGYGPCVFRALSEASA